MAAEGPTVVSPFDHKRPVHGEASVPIRRMRIGLGTWVVIEASGCSAACALKAVESAFAQIRHVEQCMHPDREGSDLRRLSEARIGEQVVIEAATWDVLRCAQRVFALSRGVFDPCLPHSTGRLSDLELSMPGDAPWARTHTHLSIDCGGIAKGYAVDCALEALREAGCTSGLVNAGGDLRVYGPQPQTLLLRHADGSYVPCELQEAALAVSDLDAANRPAEHRGYYVRDNAAPGRRRYAAVRAPQAMVADALTKCVVLCPPPLAQDLARQLSAHILA